MNDTWLSLVLKLKRVTRSVPRTIISMPNIFSDRCARPELPNLTGTLTVIKDTDFLKSYGRATAREKREDAFRDELGVALLDVLSQKGEARVPIETSSVSQI
jgi:hypothetical protein